MRRLAAAQKANQAGTRNNPSRMDAQGMHEAPASDDDHIYVPSPSQEERFTGEDSYDDIIGGKLTQQVQKRANAVKRIWDDIVHSVSKFGRSSGELLTEGVSKTKQSETLFSSLAIGIGAISGIYSIKNLLKSTRSFIDPKSEPKLSWPIFLGQGLLQGGLAAGMLAPFLGIKNIFSSVVNGKNVVKIRMLWGAVLAPIVLGVTMGIANGTSALTKLPLVGKPLKEIFGTLFGAVRSITTPASNPVNPNMPGGLPPGYAG